jgi:hypothetical protein
LRSRSLLRLLKNAEVGWATLSRAMRLPLALVSALSKGYNGGR